MPIVELSVVPTGTGSPSVGSFVRKAVQVIRESGLEYQVNPMGTCIQGDLDRIFAVVQAIHEEYARMGCARIYTTIKIDDRRDKKQTMQAKVDRALGRDG